MTTTRRTGRRPGDPDTRSEVLAAARQVFSRHGYEGASIRAIATEASVDPALVHHYFGTKQQLFRAAAAFPLDADRLLAAIHGGTPSDQATSLARFFFDVWEDEGARLPLLSVLRSAMTYDDAAALLRAFVGHELLQPIARMLDIEDAHLRVELAAAQLVGIAMLRYVVQLEPLASVAVDELVRRVVPALEHHLFAA